MTAIPNKLKFRLYFRNKTKTRKILNRNFKLQRLLKKYLKEPSHEIIKRGRINNKKQNLEYVYKSFLLLANGRRVQINNEQSI